MLRPHAGKSSQDNEIECALQQLNRLFSLLGIPVEAPETRVEVSPLACQVNSALAEFAWHMDE
jgi:hypothetical protein